MDMDGINGSDLIIIIRPSLRCIFVLYIITVS